MAHFCPDYVPPKSRPLKAYRPPVHRARRTEQEEVLEALVAQGDLGRDELALQVRAGGLLGGCWAAGGLLDCWRAGGLLGGCWAASGLGLWQGGGLEAGLWGVAASSAARCCVVH
jgi:hypothetical protein